MGAGGELVSGAIFAIGGHEDKTGSREILHAVIEALPRPKLGLVTVASRHPHKLFDTYRDAFADLGVTELVHVHIEERAEARDPTILEGVGGLFFTGGDQLGITTLLGDTALERGMFDAWHAGCVIAGTSAGASVLTETMVVRGAAEEGARIGDVSMAPGLGMLHGLIVDQHFAERGRITRLVSAVTANPRLVGVGIDEDTAIVVADGDFEVLGQGSVTVLDASGLTATNLAEGSIGSPLSAFDLCGHVLAAGDGFDIASRRPRSRSRVGDGG